jgi:ATP-dependent helicase HepA
LEQESRRVSAQEELNSMNEEVAQAKEFAVELEVADDAAEQQCSKMTRWITKGLIFKKKQGEVSGAFRFAYQNGTRGQRTLVDVRSLISKCLTGIDRRHSDWSNLVTAMMSPDRQLASHGRRVYPLRFGQPFVDTIYELMREDYRGVCDGWIRAVSGLASSEPRMFFKCTWIVDGCGTSRLPHERRLADESFRPRVLDAWIDESGEVLKNEQIQAILGLPYSSRKTRINGQAAYQDIRIRHETWGDLEDHYPLSAWPNLIDRIRETTSNITTNGALGVSLSEFAGTVSRLESISAVILLGGNT